MNNLGDYQDLYVQTDMLLADAFGNCRNKCIEIYEIFEIHVLKYIIFYLHLPGLAW